MARTCKYQPVIPAQAGIQQRPIDRVADKTLKLSRFAGLLNQLDSRLRGNDGISQRPAKRLMQQRLL